MEVSARDAYRAWMRIERLMCEVEFWEVCFEEGSRLVFCVAYSTSTLARLVISRYSVLFYLLTSYTGRVIVLARSAERFR